MGASARLLEIGHHGVMADDDLDGLYAVRPDEFTALRATLVAAAKKRGDTEAAARIGAARKPTTSAWAVNLLVHTNGDAKASLADLRDRLRAAHAAMDGAAIRALSAEQRALVDELTRAALEGADLAAPSATLREDVTGTLQAAIADPDVAARLGRLEKAERWSGFGDFGATTAVFSTARTAKDQPSARTPPEKPVPAATDREYEEAKAALTAAEHAKDDADALLEKRQNDLAVARLRVEEMRGRLTEAEERLRTADQSYADAKNASRDAAELVRRAKARRDEARRKR
jgi:hypothetical protein